jgi:hypothetical protein
LGGPTCDICGKEIGGNLAQCPYCGRWTGTSPAPSELTIFWDYCRGDCWDSTYGCCKVCNDFIRNEIDNMKEMVKDDLAILEEKKERGKLTKMDIERADDTYNKARELKSIAKESRDASIISEVTKLLETVSKLRSEVLVKGDYIEGGKTDMTGAVISRTKIGVKETGKVFKICPYCGEELNLPKTPKYCPYCGEKLK